MTDRKIAPEIYRTKYGWRVFARIAGKHVSLRIKDRDHRLSLVELRQRREALRVDARKRAKLPPPTDTGTFADAVHRKYLPAIRAAVRHYAERVTHMALWIAEFGQRRHGSIEPWEIAAVRDRWLIEGPKVRYMRWPAGERPKGCRTGKRIEIAAPLSASQVNKRLRALENFYTVVDGRHAPNPVREAGEAAEPENIPRAIDYAVLDAIIAAMPDRGRPTRGTKRPGVSLTKLRLRVIAYTGFSHGELAGIAADDLHLDEREPWVWVRGRAKGRGTRGVAQPLTKEGAAALRALADADGLGPFSPDSMRQCWRRACAVIDLEPPYPRPYDARHTFATELLEKTGNLTAVQLNMRHTDARTSRRYAERAIDPARRAGLQQAVDRGAFRSPRQSDERAEIATTASPTDPAAAAARTHKRTADIADQRASEAREIDAPDST